MDYAAGKVAAQTILGIQEEGLHKMRQHVPLIWLDLPNRHLTFSGWPRQQPDERIHFGSIRDNNYIAYHFK